MLALRVEYLTKVCMATRHDDPNRSTAEWPPHPDRLYSALVAAASELADGSEAQGNLPKPAENALRWLAQCEAPELAFSEAQTRSAPYVHMPSNPDPTEIPVSLEASKGAKDPVEAKRKKEKAALNLIPVFRKRAALPVPAVIPDDPVVHFVWPNAEPAEHLAVLRRICRHVTYLGRSRSLVQVSIVDNPPPVSLAPDPLGQVQLRVPEDGRIDYLIEKYKRDGGKPEPSLLRRYREIAFKPQETEAANTILERMYIFRPQPSDPTLAIESTLKITHALRRALIRCVHDEACGCDNWRNGIPAPEDARNCYSKIPAIISGHEPDSSVTKRPHIAFAALPFVHSRVRHADGTIKGVAVLVPRNPSEEALQLLAAGLLRLEKKGLRIPGIGTWRLMEVPADDPPIATLDLSSWLGPSRIWTTATPMVFGHFPKKKTGGEPGIILESIRMLGIDPDLVTEISSDSHSPLHGAPPSWQMKARGGSRLNGRTSHLLRHVTIRFDRAVQGPVALGCMRFLGLGLMKPLKEA